MSTIKIDKCEKNDQIQYAVAGATSGGITRALCQPLDVIKIRFQLQLEPISSGSKYSSTLQAFKTIIREEGVKTLWSGHVPAQYLSISFGLIQFYCYEYSFKYIQRKRPNLLKHNRHSVNFICGGVSASLATIFSFPFDTVRTRLVAEEKNKRVYSGVVNTFMKMIKTEGAKSLFKGLLPTLGQIAPHAGLQFVVYKLFTDNILIHSDMLQRKTDVPSTVKLTLIANLIAGGFAGLVAKFVVYPIDLAKKRLQIQGFQEYRTDFFGRQIYCKGFIECLVITIKGESIFGLFKGLSPSLLKAVCTTALHFGVYEEVKHLLGKL